MGRVISLCGDPDSSTGMATTRKPETSLAGPDQVRTIFLSEVSKNCKSVGAATSSVDRKKMCFL